MQIGTKALLKVPSLGSLGLARTVWTVLRMAPLRALAAMASGFFQELVTWDLLCPGRSTCRKKPALGVEVTLEQMSAVFI